jgi:hypothetical protein
MVISRYPRSKFQLLKIQSSLLMLSKCFIIFFTLKKKKKNLKDFSVLPWNKIYCNMNCYNIMIFWQSIITTNEVKIKG